MGVYYVMSLIRIVYNYTMTIRNQTQVLKINDRNHRKSSYNSIEVAIILFSTIDFLSLYISHIASVIVSVCLSLCITLLPPVSYLSVSLSLNIASNERANYVQQTQFCTADAALQYACQLKIDKINIFHTESIKATTSNTCQRFIETSYFEKHFIVNIV